MAAQDIKRVWDIIEKVHTGMLTTRSADGLRARPLDARPDRDEGIIWFVTDVRAGKDDEIAAAPDVCLVFVDANDKAYLSISGRASVTRDPAKAAQIWKKMDDVWWPGGPHDPNVRVLRVEPHTAELWDGPGTIVAAFELAKWRLTGAKPNVGEERKKTVRMG
jgi:general stress protein 26